MTIWMDLLAEMAVTPPMAGSSDALPSLRGAGMHPRPAASEGGDLL